jgi:hypothetical protein
VGWGVVVHNLSPRAAQAVLLTITLLGSDGAVLERHMEPIPVIPAGKRFFVGEGDVLVGSQRVHSIKAAVECAWFGGRSGREPRVSDVRIVKDSSGRVAEVRGTLINDTGARLPRLTAVSCVLSDAEGGVVGGGTGFLESSLAPGATAVFHITVGVSCSPASQAAHAHVSVRFF